MRLIQATALSSFDDYHIVQAPTPEPDKGEVLVRIAACSVGYVDALTALGGYQVKPPLPFTPGVEVSGVVERLGPGAPAALLGAAVSVYVGGGFRDYAVAPVRAVTKVPEGVSLAQAATYRTNYATALHGLVDRGRLQRGERLLVLGAAGGVGLAAVQIGRLLGAEVIAVASSAAKRDFAALHGAHHVLDADPAGWRDRLKALIAGKGVDVVYDPVCGPLFEPAFRSLAWRGRHLVVGFVGGPIPALPANLTLMKGADLIGVDIRQFGLFEAEKAAANQDQLHQWLADGSLAPAVGQAFPFDRFREALTHAMSGQGLGKAVLLME
jgi:NADPH2:quinone reductase